MTTGGAHPADIRPPGAIIVPASATYPRNDEASALPLNNGDLLLVWSRFNSLNRPESAAVPTLDRQTGLPGKGLESDNAGSTIAGMISTNGGHRWNSPRTVVENTAGLNVMNPSLARLADGAIGLAYNHRESTTTAYRVFRRSTDEGRTWSEPTYLTTEGYTTGCNDRLLVLKSGRVLAPLHSTDDWHSHYLHTRIAWSDDHGRSWQLGQPIKLPEVAASGESGAWEADAVQREDGSLLLILRTAMGTLFRAESDDDGVTWIGLRSLEVVAPVAPAVIRRIPGTGDLLLIWNWHYDWREPMAGLRRPLACAVSGDGGASWPLNRRKILEDDPAYTCAYPSCVFIGATALVTYYVSDSADPFGRRSLKCLHLPMDWLYS